MNKRIRKRKEETKKCNRKNKGGIRAEATKADKRGRAVTGKVKQRARMKKKRRRRRKRGEKL